MRTISLALFSVPLILEGQVDAGKLRASINGDRCWQSSISLDAEAERHHTGAVRRWVEGQVVGSNASGVRKNEQRQPAFAQWFAGTRVAKNEI